MFSFSNRREYYNVHYVFHLIFLGFSFSFFIIITFHAFIAGNLQN